VTGEAASKLVSPVAFLFIGYSGKTSLLSTSNTTHTLAMKAGQAFFVPLSISDTSD